MIPRARQLIERLSLVPHPEGGFYAEVHRSAAQVDPRDGRGIRSALTSIHFLLVDEGSSRWHRVRSDEMWCHLEGAPLTLHRLAAAGSGMTVESTLLAPVSELASPQCVVPADVWQAATSRGDYSLVACLVAPGFDFVDFTMMRSDDPCAAWLRTHHPALAALI
ncbi:MAG: cupin domain-containing protein [Caldimonas sp.]